MDLLPELGTLAEFGALCSAQSSIDQPYDDQAAILAGLSFAEQLDASLLDRACIVTLLTALQQIVARYYECNIFNAVAVRSWKLLCGAITKVDFSEADGVQLVWEKAATVIASLAADTLDSLLADLTTFDIGVAPSEADLQPVAGKMKFLGFTAQRSVELLSVTWTGMTSLQQCPCMVTLLRTIGTFNLVAGYSSMFDELIVKSVEAAGDLLNPQRIPITALSRILSACEHAGYDLHIGLCKLMLHLVYSGALEAAGASTVLELGSVIATVVHGLCCLATACTGALSDAYLEDLIREVAEALSALLANAPDAGTLQSHMATLVGAACPQQGDIGHCTVARQLLGAVLASFPEDDQEALAGLAWSTVTDRLQCTRSTDGSLVQHAARCVRHLLLALAPPAAHVLLMEVFGAVIPTETAVDAGDAADHSKVPTYVAEELVKHLPLAHLFGADPGGSIQQLVRGLVEKSVSTLLGYGGEGGQTGLRTADPVAQSGPPLPVGVAVAVLHATAGSHDSPTVRAGAEQCEGWRNLRYSVVNNVALGTILLRWISSLSEHVKTLLCGSEGGKASNNANSGRPERASTLLRTLTTLQRCLWNHRIPRAVQGILCRGALCCLQAATAASSYSSRGTPASEVVLSAMLYASDCMTLVGGTHTNEQSIDVIKAVYAEWTSIALYTSDWRHLVLLLSSLQSFANSLPAPMRPRARELVAPALVPIIQARSLGRTYSPTMQGDVTLADGENIEVLQELSLGGQASYAPGQSDSIGDRQRPRSSHQDDEGGEDHKARRTRAEDLRDTLLHYAVSGDAASVPTFRVASVVSAAGEEGESSQGEMVTDPEVAILVLDAAQLQRLQAEGIDGPLAVQLVPNTVLYE